jgi:hypothetical protein
MDKKAKTTLILAGVAVAAYLAYRWYMNKQANSQSTGQLGSNLNSVAPALIGGSSGPTSGLSYYAGATNVYTAAPVSTSSSPTTPTTPTTPTGTGRRWPIGTGTGITTPASGGSGSNTLPTPVLAYGQTITTVSGLKAALAAAANPFKAKQSG